MATQIKDTSKCRSRETFCATKKPFHSVSHTSLAQNSTTIQHIRKNKSLQGLRKIVGVSVYPFFAGKKNDNTCKHEAFPYTVFKYGILHNVLKISNYQGIIVQNINPFTAICYYSSGATRIAAMLFANTDVMRYGCQHCCVTTPLMY
jgi:hypothetical protein